MAKKDEVHDLFDWEEVKSFFKKHETTHLLILLFRKGNHITARFEMKAENQ